MARLLLHPGNGAYGGMQSTDFVANLRVDQAWGSAQIMGAAHEVNASYYSPGLPAGCARCIGSPGIRATVGAGRRALA